VDNDKAKIDVLLSGRMPIYEPGLDKVVAENVKNGRLIFTTSIADAVKNCRVLFIAVGTPPKDTGEPDLSYVEAVAREIGENMTEYTVIVEKSTVPVQTGKWVKRTIDRYNRRKTPYDVASNPEFLREGSSLNDFLYPDRIVIGCETDRARELLLEVYKPIEGKKLV